ncbi:MAG: HigA family addiction module antitoxin [Rhodospirillales bacterium]
MYSRLLWKYHSAMDMSCKPDDRAERHPEHPGRILRDRVMTPLGVSRNRLARDIDVPVGRVSELVSGKRSITPDTALRLAKYFGTSAELWLRLQWEYDLHRARTTRWPTVEERVRVLSPSTDGDAAVVAALDD